MAETQPEDRGQILEAWDFPEYTHPERGRWWYLSFVAIVVVVVATSIWSGNYTFVMIILIAAVIYFVRMRQTPPRVTLNIFEDGIQVGERYYKWEEFKEFVILYKPPEVKKLIFEFKQAYRPAIDIALENQNPLRLRSIVSERLSENIEREEEPLTDQWARALKL